MTTKEKRSIETRRKESETKPARRRVWAEVPVGMLVAIAGGAGMGAAAVMVASGRPLGLLELYASLAITAVVARLVYRRGGMFLLCVYAALAGMATALGPALMG